MPVAGTQGLLRRIEKRASPQLKAAIEAGLVSSRKGHEMIYWTLARQRRYIKARRREKDRSSAVATTIREYMDSLNGRQPDLEQLRLDLQSEH
jgi:hypothetical protein